MRRKHKKRRATNPALWEGARLVRLREIKARLERHPDSIRQFCIRHKFPPESMCRWLGEKRIPYPRTLTKIEAALDRDARRKGCG